VVHVPGCEVRVSVDADGTVVLCVVGELDLATIGALRDAFESLPLIGAQRVVLDVADVGFLSAAGIRVALEAQRRLAEHGGQLVLRGPSALLMRVLRAADVEHDFEIDRPTADLDRGRPR
jgi:anti-sigma B factor antagonist